MRYGSSPVVCSNLSYGEVEDYTIEWINGENGDEETLGLQIHSANNSFGGEMPEQVDAKSVRDATPLQIHSGSNSLDEKMPWQVYPNPVRNTAQVRGGSPAASGAELIILNQQGRIVLRNTAQLEKGSNELSVDLNQLPAGLYQLMIVTDQWKENLRVVKQ